MLWAFVRGVLKTTVILCWFILLAVLITDVVSFAWHEPPILFPDRRIHVAAIFAWFCISGGIVGAVNHRDLNS